MVYLDSKWLLGAVWESQARQHSLNEHGNRLSRGGERKAIAKRLAFISIALDSLSTKIVASRRLFENDHAFTWGVHE
jgi:hypothetical protein